MLEIKVPPAPAIIRNYHSTALLLPSGRVLVAGGEFRKYYEFACGSMGMPVAISGPSDYQIWSPPYLFGGARPAILSVSGTTEDWSLGSIKTVFYETLPNAVSISKAVPPSRYPIAPFECATRCSRCHTQAADI